MGLTALLVLGVSPRPHAIDAAPSSQPRGAPGTPALATEHWSLYRNSRHAYQIDVPPSAFLDESRPDAVRFLFKQEVQTDTNTISNEFSVTISVHGNPELATADQWARQALGRVDPGAIRNAARTHLAGLPAYRASILEGDELTVHLYIERGARVFEVSFPDPRSIGNFPAALQSNYHELFDRMLNSFRPE